MAGLIRASPIRCGGLERSGTRHASSAVRPARSEAAGNGELVNGSLSVNLRARLSDGDAGAVRKTKWCASKSGARQLQKEDTQVGSDELLITCYRRDAFDNMPAIKKERLDGEDMALAAFNQPEYLAPLNATAIPVVTPHPPSYDHIFAHHRAYLGLHDTALHQQHLHHHTDDLMLERFSSIPDFQPFFDNGEPCIEVECGENKALLYINKLCQGSKGPSIKYRGEWLTPNEFQFVSGRETAKDWKRSIRHKGKSLKTLMSKGILQVHPPICDCPGCRISSPVNRGRLAEKRTIPLPPSRVPKKELASVFSSDDSEGSERVSLDHADIKQEEELHYTMMRKSSRDSDLSTIISNLHHTRQHGMPEGQPCSDITLASAHSDDVVGKKRAYSPNSSSECPSDSKKSRSASPKENSQTPALEPAGHMTPEEHYRRMMSALNDHTSYDEQQQRLYQLATNMGIPGHELLRVRQEAMAAGRNPGALEAHLPGAGSSSSQRRKQGLPQHRDAQFTEREMSHPPPLLSPQNAPHIALGPHLRPPFLGMPSALCQTPAYGFLPPAQAEMFARQQEILRKQNLARLEMSAELLRQKELESLQRQRLLAEPLGLHAGLPAEHPALRSLQDIPEGHPLRDEITRRNAMLVLRHNSAPLLSLNHQAAAAAAAVAGTSFREAIGRKSHRKGGAPQAEHQGSEARGEGRQRETDGHDEDMKDSDSDGEAGEERPEGTAKADGQGPDSEACQSKDAANPGEGLKELGEGSGRLGVPCGSAGPDSPSHHLFTPGLGKSEVKYLPPAALPPFPALAGQTLPFGFPYASPYFHTGAMGGLFTDGEEAAAEDVGKWSVEEVFREQAIDGETLPLLTEEHLLNNMGLKLGPALKIRSQVARRIGRIFYMTSFPLALPLPPSALRPPDRDPLPAETRPPSAGSTSSPFPAPPACRASPKQENGNPHPAGAYDSTKAPS
ncbi:sterile alpha motif domain-containing protein 11 isoform X3 [Electrophorus electricus]|uniref:sterile alpha motif domain-containing protein 11 isoform X3 n=1 Tax=Electrophorus electricus TaxID=8005 RepID=UPI0015D0AA11|nr:sterile alpha motif domain-containing protein 11 isoform X3 [Electrophorus electricus]